MPKPPNFPPGNRPFARMSRNQAQQVLTQALALHQNGRLDEATTLYEQILQVDARNFDALHLLGIVAAQTKNYARAADLIGKAIKINPNVAIAHNNRGNALKDLRDFESAVASYNRAIALNQGYAEAYYNRGVVFEELKHLEKAVKSYDRAIALNPGLPAAHYNRGNALKDLGQLDTAIESYDRAIALKPDHAEAYSNRGAALGELKQLEKAVESCDRAIALNPHLISAYYNRGNALKDLGHLDAAVESYDRAIALKPNYAEAYCNRGAALEELQQSAAAFESFDRAIALKPDLAEAHYNRGNALEDLKQPENAIQSYSRALALKPNFDFLPGELLHMRHNLCDWNSYDDDIKRIENSVFNGEKAMSPFPFLAISDSVHLQRLAAEIWAKARYSSTKTLGPIPRRPRSGRIRIAYLSADFHESPMGHNLAGYFEAHDRLKFETYAISFGPDMQSPMRKRLVAAFDHFIDMRENTDLEIARTLRDLQIDIAVDTMGPTRNQRARVFAMRCAPIQINQFGWTSGADFMDYIVADTVVLPPGHEPHFTEKVVRVPYTYFTTDDQRLISGSTPTRAESGLPETGFVFCVFNNSYKITPPVFDIWMRLLHRVEGSVLWLREKNLTAAQNLRAEAQKRGIDSDRLVFAPTTPSMADHLARHRLADLFLDNFPFCAQTTASDALWTGLPLITRVGESITSRIAASLLNAIGLPELITQTPQEYEAKALELATDPVKLGEIRRKLEKNRTTSPAFNTKLYTRHMEAAYAAMYDRHYAGLPPDHISIDSQH